MTAYTDSNLLTEQDTGSNTNTWGEVLNAVLALIDAALDGWTTLVVSGNHTLTASNGVADEARSRVLKLTTATSTYTLTLNARKKWYLIWNATSAAQTIACAGGGTSVSLGAGDIMPVFCDAVNVKELGFGGVGIKAYVDNLAWTYNAGALPAQTGNADKYVSTDGTTAAWRTFSAPASAVRTGTSTQSALTPGDTYSALAEVTLTSSSNHIANDMANYINGVHTFTENTTLDNPTNPKVGQSGYIRLVQHASSAKTLAFGTNWKRVGGAPTVSTTLGGTDILVYQVITSTYILYDLLKNPS